jgi:hypothetical protein
VRCIEASTNLAKVLPLALSLMLWSGVGFCAQPATSAAPPGPPMTPKAAKTTKAAPVKLAAPLAASTWEDFKLQAARRLVAANPDGTYMGPVADELLAIPVLEIELDRDGRVRRIEVLRYPTQAEDTTQLAIDAVHRAAPFGDMSRLSPPWKFVEVFLFDDERRFKPRTLDD